jgi:Restriction endonuclease S subunits
MAESAFSEKKHLRLSDLAELSLGYSFRGRVEETPDGETRLIQMRDLTPENTVDSSGAVRIGGIGFSNAHYLNPGDLVFRARGANNAAALAEALPERTALASPLIKIRAKMGLVEPRYLQWFINLPMTQAYIGAGLQGSLVRMVSIEHLARLRIVVPPPETQRRIVEMASLSAREADLLRRIADLSESLGRSIVMERILGIDRRTYGE